MSQQTNIAAALLRIVNAIVTVNGRVGSLSALTSTDKTSIVAALNELKGIVSGLSSGAVIDDAGASASTVWSSTKTQTQINAAIAALISGAPDAQDTLAELASQITALAQADAGLLSFAQGQSLDAAQQLQACENLGLGDPAHNYLTDINAELAGTGL